MSQFTPGPWHTLRAVKPDNTGGFDWAVLDSENNIIAESFQNVDTYVTRPVEANARLIATVPDLYGALCKLIDAHDEDPPTLTEAEWGNARAARAKAEGRS